MRFGKFIAQTVFGSWIIKALIAGLTQYLIIIMDPDQILWSWQSLKSLGIAISISVVPIIINYLNKFYLNYGPSKTEEIIKKEGE